MGGGLVGYFQEEEGDYYHRVMGYWRLGDRMVMGHKGSRLALKAVRIGNERLESPD